MIASEILLAGGSFSIEPDSSHRVSYWHIPGGWDYNNAVVMECFFNNEQAAKRFVDSYSAAPEMAVMENWKP